MKPDLGAPDTDIVAARAAGTLLGDKVGDDYTAVTGTAMAAAHVAGTAALVVQAQPSASSAQRRNRLSSTADLMFGAEITAQGAGQVDADQATAGSVSVDQAKLEFGRLSVPRALPVTYRNPGSTPVRLDLAAYVSDASPPTLSTPTVEVPAGGQVTIQVTAGPATAHRIGALLATPTDGGDPLVTTFGWRSP